MIMWIIFVLKEFCIWNVDFYGASYFLWYYVKTEGKKKTLGDVDQRPWITLMV